MTIKAVTPADDLSSLARLHEASFEQAWTQTALRDLLKITGTIAFSTSDGFVMARVVGNEAEVLTITVAPSARRRGIGSALLREGARRACELGARTMFLEVGESNAAARALYTRSGFFPVGRRRLYYGPSEDALVLRADLPLLPLGNPEASIRV